MIELAELDLNDDSAVLPPSDREAWVLLRAGRLVLDQVVVPPLSVAEAARHTARLRADWIGRLGGRTRPDIVPNTPSAADVTIVVCTRDRPQLLEGCLASLMALRPAPGRLLVVDNAPSDDRAARLCAERGVNRLHEPTPGLNVARNRGMRAAETSIVAYVDDDARADRAFAVALAAAFSAPEVAAVTGLVLPAELRTTAQLVFEREGGMGKGFARREFQRDRASVGMEPFRLGVGANMAFRTAVLSELGGFDSRLGVGTPTRGAGDLDMLARVHAAGGTIVYEPSVLVRHIHRRSRHALVSQMYDNGVAFSALLTKIAREQSSLAGVVARYRVRWYVHRHLLRAVRALRRRQLFTLRLVAAEAAGGLRGGRAFAAAEHRPFKRSRRRPRPPTAGR